MNNETVICAKYKDVHPWKIEIILLKETIHY